MKKIDRARKETESLARFLEKREWINADKLPLVFEEAADTIAKIEFFAITNTIAKLEKYLAEARGWAENKQTGMNGQPLRINKKEQEKARAEANRIERTIAKLRELI